MTRTQESCTKIEKMIAMEFYHLFPGASWPGYELALNAIIEQIVKLEEFVQDNGHNLLCAIAEAFPGEHPECTCGFASLFDKCTCGYADYKRQVDAMAATLFC